VVIQLYETVKEKNTDSLSISPAFGFHMISRKKRMDFGFIFSGGTFVKKHYDYSFNRSNGQNDEESYSSQFEMVKSPSVTLGILKRFVRSSISAETVFFIPTKYDDKDFSADDSSPVIVVKDSRCKNTFRFDQRLGYEYFITKSVAVSCGMGFIQMRQNNDLSSSTGSSENSVDVRIFLFSLGFDKKISSDTKIIVASSNYMILNKLEMETSVLSIKINSYEFVPNIMFALVQKF